MTWVEIFGSGIDFSSSPRISKSFGNSFNVGVGPRAYPRAITQDRPYKTPPHEEAVYSYHEQYVSIKARTHDRICRADQPVAPMPILVAANFRPRTKAHSYR